MDCLIEFNTGKGSGYRDLRTRPAGPGARLRPVDFDSARYQSWRGNAAPAFEQVWGDIEVGRDFGAYCRTARKAILQQKLSKWGWWESWLSADYHRAKSEVISLDEIRNWTAANWEARVVVDVLSNFVPLRLEAARRRMLTTPVEIVFRVAEHGGSTVDLESLDFASSLASFTVLPRTDHIALSTFLGELPKLQGFRQLQFTGTERDTGRQVRGELETSEILNHANWQRLVQLKDPLIRIDLRTVRVDGGPRKVRVELHGANSPDARIDVGSQSFKPADGESAGTWEASLDPGVHLARATGAGPQGERIERTVLVPVPPSQVGQPEAVVLSLDPAIVVAQAGTLDAIRAAIRADASRLRSNAISPGEYTHAVSRRSAKPKARSGRRTALVPVATPAARGTGDRQAGDAPDDLSARATIPRGLPPQSPPQEHRRSSRKPAGRDAQTDPRRSATRGWVPRGAHARGSTHHRPRWATAQPAARTARAGAGRVKGGGSRRAA